MAAVQICIYNNFILLYVLLWYYILYRTNMKYTASTTYYVGGHVELSCGSCALWVSWV